MQNIAAYTLVSQKYDNALSTAEMKVKILELLSVIEATVCEESLDLFLSNIEGKTYSEVIATGAELMKSQLASSASSGPSDAKANNGAAAEEEKEESEESEANMDFF